VPKWLPLGTEIEKPPDIKSQAAHWLLMSLRFETQERPLPEAADWSGFGYPFFARDGMTTTRIPAAIAACSHHQEMSTQQYQQ